VSTLAYGSRPHPALGRAATLSALVHLALLVVLFLGVRFQNRPAAVVTVELWEAPPPPQPVVEQPKPPPPPPPEVKPEPQPEVKKPDIAVIEKPKPKPKPKPEPPKRDLAAEKRMREEAAKEEKALQEQQRIADAARRERDMRALLAKQEADARAKALATWVDKIRIKIRGNILFDVTQIPNNPEAIFDVSLLPNGEVLNVRRRKSSGNPGYDDAVERAILKSSPLPKPDDPSMFQRQLELKFRPQDK